MSEQHECTTEPPPTCGCPHETIFGLLCLVLAVSSSKFWDTWNGRHDAVDSTALTSTTPLAQETDEFIARRLQYDESIKDLPEAESVVSAVRNTAASNETVDTVAYAGRPEAHEEGSGTTPDTMALEEQYSGMEPPAAMRHMVLVENLGVQTALDRAVLLGIWEQFSTLSDSELERMVENLVFRLLGMSSYGQWTSPFLPIRFDSSGSDLLALLDIGASFSIITPATVGKIGAEHLVIPMREAINTTLVGGTMTHHIELEVLVPDASTPHDMCRLPVQFAVSELPMHHLSRQGVVLGVDFLGRHKVDVSFRDNEAVIGMCNNARLPLSLEVGSTDDM